MTMEVKPVSEKFAETFHFLHTSGDKLYPVKIKDRVTGKLAWRVSEDGNRKDSSIEAFDEAELRNYVLSRKYAVRAATKNSDRKGLYRPNQRSLVSVVDSLDSQSN